LNSRFDIYSSSAGSGKTYTLVKEYLKLILSDDYSLESVMAITFTNKATSEMKERLMSNLYKISSGGSDDMLSDLMDALACDENKLRQKAGVLLHTILHQYSKLNISTIDSFYYNLLRHLSRELNVALRYELQLDTDEIKEYLRNYIFEECESNKDLQKWLTDFILNNLEQDKRWDIDDELKNISQQLFSENKRVKGIDRLLDINDVFKSKLHANLNMIEKNYQSKKVQFQNALISYNLTVDDFNNKSSGAVSIALKSELYLDAFCGHLENDNSRIMQFYHEPEKGVTKGTHSTIKDIVTQKIHPVYKELIDFAKDHYVDYSSYTSLLSQMYLGGLLKQLDEGLKKYRQEKEKLLLSDVQLILQKSMDNAAVGLVYEKTGARLKALLIDEFQDTSDIQWKNFLPLAENALAEGGTLLLVGDLKQSIYRFRGGNMELMATEVHKDLSVFNSILNQKTLDGNYRSLSNVVDFNNAFFSGIENSLDDYSPLLTQAYAPSNVHQINKRSSENKGYVQIEFVQKEEITKEKKKKLAEEYLLSRLSFKIIELLDKGYELKDMAILVNTKNEGYKVAAALADHQITQIISNDSLMLTSAPHVLFLLHCLTYIQDQDNLIALTSICRFVLQQNVNSSSALDQINQPIQKEQLLSFLPSPLKQSIHPQKQKAVYDTVLQLAELMGFTLSSDLYFDRFVDLIHVYRNQAGTSIQSFLKWWDDNHDSDKCCIKSSESINAIRISTIHKSKGLQYKIVFIPFTDKSFVGSGNKAHQMWVELEHTPLQTKGSYPLLHRSSLSYTWFKNEYDTESKLQQIDTINAFYVAFTRAENMLYIYSIEPSSKNSKSNEVKRVDQLIKERLNSALKYLKEKEEDHSKIWYIGDEVSNTVQHKHSTSDPIQMTEALTLGAQTNRDWNEFVFLRSTIGEKERILSAHELDASNTGILAHHLLSLSVQKNNFKEALDLFLIKSKYPRSILNEVIDASEKAFQLLQSKKWIPVSKDRVFTEQEFAMPNGNIFRPDLIIQLNDRFVLIDYKYAERSPLHHEQLKTYQAVLMEAGFTPLELYLLYLPETELIRIDA